jgi:hypothetical protein
MLPDTFLALVAAALISGGSATGAVAFGGGFGGAGGGYPASFGSDYAEAGGDCHLIAQRVMTRHGWRTRQVRSAVNQYRPFGWATTASTETFLKA